ncbi:hypothetical protein GCM10009744_49930 [Kribbella alba]|uniref:N-acetyltransferase domain-containing protein n=2 Tax=Kribbella alba TaxID=190197 RepID=A0ABN2FL48_9ACTN
MELKEIGPEDVAEVQLLIESDPGYTERITGYPPGQADAESLLMARPEGLSEDAKVVLGVWEDDQLVAVVDLLRGYPTGHTGFIGLLEVHGGPPGAGSGRRGVQVGGGLRRDGLAGGEDVAVGGGGYQRGGGCGVLAAARVRADW